MVISALALVFLASGFGVWRYTEKIQAEKQAMEEQLPLPVRIMWFEQYSADVVAEISKKFTEETGIPVIVDQVSLAKWQDITYQELQSGYPRFDLAVGDSQWIGYGAEHGYYEDLTDFVQEHKILGTFSESVARGYGEYPEGSGRFYAVPFGTNTIVYAYRNDWFEDPVEQAAFREQYGRALAAPRTYAELRDIAKFFYRPDENRYGIVYPASEFYDVVTMLYGSMLFGYGGSWGDRATCKADGHINGEDAVTALELYRELATYAPPEIGTYAYAHAWTRFFEGDTAIAMNFISHTAVNPYAADTGYVAGLFGPKSRDVQLAGQGVSLVKGARNREGALKFLDWWVQYETQDAFAEGGGLSSFRRVTSSRKFQERTPYNEAYAVSIEHVKDYWNSPRYAELLLISQKYFHEYVTGKTEMTAKETLDTILNEWKPILAGECE